MRLTKKCHGCSQVFRREELIDYTSPGTKTMFSYCPKCLEQKHARERFSNTVCMIFGIKSPGPRIWKERQRIIDTYGYTDDTIIECLDYIYNVEKKKKYVESLCLVTPSMMEKMMRYKKQQDRQAWTVANAFAAADKIKVHIVPGKQKEEQLKDWDPDDFLDED